MHAEEFAAEAVEIIEVNKLRIATALTLIGMRPSFDD